MFTILLRMKESKEQCFLEWIKHCKDSIFVKVNKSINRRKKILNSQFLQRNSTMNPVIPKMLCPIKLDYIYSNFRTVRKYFLFCPPNYRVLVGLTSAKQLNVDSFVVYYKKRVNPFNTREWWHPYNKN